MIYAFQLYYLVCTLFLAGKDADSYQLKARQDNALSAGRINRWHRDGVVLAILYLVAPVCLLPFLAWKMCIAALLIRASVFDLAFNHWAGLPELYLGGTAWADKLLVRIFGTSGAVKKSLTFFALLVGLNVLNHFL